MPSPSGDIGCGGGARGRRNIDPMKTPAARTAVVPDRAADWETTGPAGAMPGGPARFSAGSRRSEGRRWQEKTGTTPPSAGLVVTATSQPVEWCGAARGARLHARPARGLPSLHDPARQFRRSRRSDASDRESVWAGGGGGPVPAFLAGGPAGGDGPTGVARLRARALDGCLVDHRGDAAARHGASSPGGAALDEHHAPPEGVGRLSR